MALEQPDPEVLRRAQRGDRQAFETILRAYETPVHNYVLRLTGDRTLAEDMTQEVFVRVYQGLPRFALRSTFTTWLFQVTKNRVLDELRARERRPRTGLDLARVAPVAVWDPPFERSETVQAVWRAVGHLNTDLRMALLLRDVVGLSYGEIGEVLQITLPTVKWRIFKAREAVQVALTGEGLFVPVAASPAVAAAAPALL
ncbi:MAG: RNA polymerase sigma factor [Actinomycetes bacterium]